MGLAVVTNKLTRRIALDVNLGIISCGCMTSLSMLSKNSVSSQLISSSLDLSRVPCRIKGRSFGKSSTASAASKQITKLVPGLSLQIEHNSNLSFGDFKIGMGKPSTAKKRGFKRRAGRDAGVENSRFSRVSSGMNTFAWTDTVSLLLLSMWGTSRRVIT